MKRRDSITFKGKAAHEAFLGFKSALKVDPPKHTQLESKLCEALMLVLDQVDYTRGACVVTEMIGAVLQKEIIQKARETLNLALHGNEDYEPIQII